MNVIEIQSRSMSDPPHSDIDFKNEMTLVELPLTLIGKFPGYELDRFMENSSKTEQLVKK